jgi:hypothetical protein
MMVIITIMLYSLIYSLYIYIYVLYLCVDFSHSRNTEVDILRRRGELRTVTVAMDTMD